MLRTGASIGLMSQYLLSRFRRHPQFLEPHAEKAKPIQVKASSLKISDQWALRHVPIWSQLFDFCGLSSKREVRGLEIGSWEGLSSFCFLELSPHATLTCVDTWEGADEHKAAQINANNPLSVIEQKFEANLEKALRVGRVIKWKGTSQTFFSSPREGSFDFIYVDGSHRARDVVLDAVSAFELLEPGGLLIFDDYLWRYYAVEFENPASAINYFLRLVASRAQILYIWEQVAIRKTQPS